MPRLFGQERILLMEELLTVTEVAEILRVDPTTVRRWIKAGILKAVALPRRNKRTAFRIKRETVNELLNEGLPQEGTIPQE